MKKILIITVLITLFMVTFLVGCAKDETATTEDFATTNTSTKADEYNFIYNDININLGVEARTAVDALGEPLSYFEAPSCAFEGVDKIYYYNGFELYTYPKDGVDFISSIALTDDSVQTIEGAYIGMAKEDIVNIYGKEYTEELGLYKYTKADTSISFLFEDDSTVSIAYNYDNLKQ